MLVSARGVVLQRLTPGRPATGLFAVPQLTALTPYDRFGEGPLLLVLALAALARALVPTKPKSMAFPARCHCLCN